jgi:SPP1 family predicted phage head-tail adaptor
MRIAAGELDRRIAIWRAAMVDDGTATDLGVPTQIGKRWAKKTDISDAERVRASEQGQAITTRFLVRADPLTRTITGKDTIRHKRREYEVVGAKDSDEREDGIEITVTARPDQADVAP